ncbi:MAG TPA: hypothetical protein VK870_10310 [Ignavibacteriaceae bacterium]|nr:hypothetical protein [Ignavibacteriaceae bacterium]
MKIKILYVLILTIVLSGSVSFSVAQSGGLYFSLAFPMGEFKENLKQTGVGLNGEFFFLTPKRNLPVGLGVNLGYYVYGMEKRSEPWSSTIPDVRVDIERTNNLTNFHLVFLIAPEYGRFRPYAEGLFGGNYFFTKSSVKSRFNEDVIAEDVNFDDWAWSYGVGGGLTYLVSGDPNINNNAIFLDFKVRYLFGSEAEYLKKGSIQIVNGNLFYDINKSKTDLLSAHLGVRIFFSWNPQQ